MIKESYYYSCEVCLLVPRTIVALVPRGHSRFCLTCADTYKRVLICKLGHMIVFYQSQF